MLSHSDKEEMLREFPNIKLSYENIIYKKVSNQDYIVAIPEGKKCFAWFTFIHDKPNCLLMELTDRKQIVDIKIISTCFSPELSYGTILYGTLFYANGNNFFSMEDIFSYKGVNLERMNWGEKLVKLNTLLKKDIKQISYNKSFIVFGLPLMCKTIDELNKKIENENIKYKISSVQFKLFNRVNSHLFMTFKNYSEVKPFELEEKLANKERSVIIQQQEQEQKQQQNNQTQDGNKTLFKKQTKKEQVFLVRPDIQDDIYYLFCLNKQLKEEQYGFAHIPDYNTSVMMNKLFRVIKENQNLDALEESDDEEEFENEDIHKFVHLNKSYNMVCVFNYKFKKWVPIKLANKEAPIVNMYDLN
jgi:hypothetical protein